MMKMKTSVIMCVIMCTLEDAMIIIHVIVVVTICILSACN